MATKRKSMNRASRRIAQNGAKIDPPSRCYGAAGIAEIEIECADEFRQEVRTPQYLYYSAMAMPTAAAR